MSSQQLTLNVSLREGFRFASFFVGNLSVNSAQSNFEVVGALKAFVSNDSFAQATCQQNFVWGEKNSGKTHLLQACCAEQARRKGIISYIPLKTMADFGPDILSGLSHSQLIVIDDIDRVIASAPELASSQRQDWELALFNLINRARENGQRLLFSSRKNPRNLNCILPDLGSRLIWGGCYQLHALSDEDKRRAMQARAQQRGFELSDRVVDYLFKRYPRDIKTLMDILDRLDKESLRQKTLITVPFVKQVLE